MSRRDKQPNSLPLADELSREVSQMDAPELMTFIVQQVAQKNASDLFFLAGENYYQVDMRRLGTMETIVRVPKSIGQQLINTIKTQAGMDLAEKRKPTDGRWTMESEHPPLNVDFRLNSMGTMNGEDLALRVLRTSDQLHALDDLGFIANQLPMVKSLLDRPAGLLLVTGPTASGKTTTLYACLQALNNGRRKINTLEDPIEHRLEGVRQSQVAPKMGLDFSELLAGAMRQAPDIIMVGEIRDNETAMTAVRAANSGHLVLSTMHSPTATSAVQSLMALGIHPFFLAHSLVGVIAQRLIRTLDPETRVAYPIGNSTGTFDDVQELLEGGEGDKIWGPPIGQEHPNAGYIGQAGLFEIMENTLPTQEGITARLAASELRQRALEHGMLDFRRVGLLKVARGITSIEEVMRVIPVEDQEGREPDLNA